MTKEVTKINGRRINKYPLERYGKRGKAEKWGVDKRDPSKPKKKRLVLFTGSGRSGTTHTAKLMKIIGLDVQHEKMGKDGTASLFFTKDSDWYPMLPWLDTKLKNHVGERLSDFEFEHIIQIVRHPLKTIPSMTKIFPSINWEWMEDNDIIPKGLKPNILRCAHAYYGLNKLAEKKATWRFKLEDYETEWPKLMKLLGQKKQPFPDVIVSNKASGFRKSEPIKWKDLQALDADLYIKIKKMAKRYGYEE